MMAVIMPTLASIEWASPGGYRNQSHNGSHTCSDGYGDKQAARKSPGRIILAGRMLSARLTVASTAPIALADAANEPAST